MTRQLTRSAGATRAAGRRLASSLSPGAVVLVEGPLGSGKTTFVQGLAAGLGSRSRVNSPSFLLVREYSLRRFGERLKVRRRAPSVVLRHIDLFRLPNPALDGARVDLLMLLADPAAITVIEWADKLPRRLANALLRRVVRVRLGYGRYRAERILELAYPVVLRHNKRKRSGRDRREMISRPAGP